MHVPSIRSLLVILAMIFMAHVASASLDPAPPASLPAQPKEPPSSQPAKAKKPSKPPSKKR
ncbi:MAG: hypothetical protein IT381_11590 [Deltaproteobacteria bacterium]|nr:hypothetical protein [Deltaproteobacteria bacterium]